MLFCKINRRMLSELINIMIDEKQISYWSYLVTCICDLAKIYWSRECNLEIRPISFGILGWAKRDGADFKMVTMALKEQGHWVGRLFL